MSKRGIVTYILYIFSTVFCFSQTDIPTDYFKNPLDIPLVLKFLITDMAKHYTYNIQMDILPYMHISKNLVQK